MCSNTRLVNSLECYMDELVDCFEDFVTKTLVILSLAIGAVIVMIAYAFKLNRNLFDASLTRQTTSDSYQPEPGGMNSSEAMTVNYAPSSQSAMEIMDSPSSDPYLQNRHNEKIRKSRSNAMPKASHNVNKSYVTGKSQNLNSDGANSHGVNKSYVTGKSQNLNSDGANSHGVNKYHVSGKPQNLNSDGANSHDVNNFFVKNKSQSIAIPKTSHSVNTSYVTSESQNLNSDGANSHDVDMSFDRNESQDNNSDVSNNRPWKTETGVPSLDERLLTSVGLSSCSRFLGMYTRQRRRNALPVPVNANESRSKTFRHFANLVSQYVWTGYNMMYGNYLVLATVFAVVLLSFLIPDISQKIHATTELKSMKKVLDAMTEEVRTAEAACFTAADEVCYLQYSMQDDTTETQRQVQDLSICTSDCPQSAVSAQVERQIGIFQQALFPQSNTSHKEIAIMSYLYTDSFNAEKPIANLLQHHHNDPDCVK